MTGLSVRQRRLTQVPVALLVAGLVWLGLPTTASSAVTVRCFGRIATKVGTNGPNVLRGTPHVDVLVGLRGNDRFLGFGSRDYICGGAGVDLVHAGRGSDRVKGGVGADLLIGDAGNDSLIGDRGHDVLLGSLGNDAFWGGIGTDICSQQGGSGANSGCENSGPAGLPPAPPPGTTPECPPTGCPASAVAESMESHGATARTASAPVEVWGSIQCTADALRVNGPVLMSTYDMSWSAWWTAAYRWNGSAWVFSGESTELGWAYNLDHEFHHTWTGWDSRSTFGAWVFAANPGSWYSAINYVYDSRNGQWEWANPQSFVPNFPYACQVG